ncbi:protein OPI10 homolog [Anabrus simplex]|uniref:protein OPI10 homolog n=1 Tax=Anabrus simplex TaxID=316456 RepID=UPI0035A39B36
MLVHSHRVNPAQQQQQQQQQQDPLVGTNGAGTLYKTIPGMFGIIISGRPAQTDFVLTRPMQFVKTVTDADSINHIVVFLTGVEPFPDGTAGLVYFCFPDGNVMLLGHLSNEKQSAVFKVSNFKKPESKTDEFMFGQQQIPNVAQIGISIEPIINVQQQSALVVSESVESVNVFGHKMLESFVNFISSYAVTQDKMTPNAVETYIPLSSVRNWYTNFQRRLQQNPTFWRS